MAHDDQVRDRAMWLLNLLATVGKWAVSGDSRAEPYLAAGAVRIVDGKPEFHKERFMNVYMREIERSSYVGNQN
jgi:hypothetical protein